MVSYTTASRLRRCLLVVAGSAFFFASCQASIPMPFLSLDLSPDGFFLDMPFIDLDAGPDGIALDMPGVDVNIRSR